MGLHLCYELACPLAIFDAEVATRVAQLRQLALALPLRELDGDRDRSRFHQRALVGRWDPFMARFREDVEFRALVSRARLIRVSEPV